MAKPVEIARVSISNKGTESKEIRSNVKEDGSYEVV